MMHEKFQMSSMGELTFFLGLQVKQKQNRIFISQDKYVAEILKKYGFSKVKNASTPMETQKPLLKDEDEDEVDVHMYRSMIGSLMYLTSSRHDIMYLKCHPKLGLWYPKDSPFDLVAYTDSDYAGASLDRKSTIREAKYVAASSCCGQVLWIQNQLLDYGVKTINEEVQLQALVDGKKVIITESTIRRDLQLKDAKGVDCLPNAAIFDQLTLLGKTKRKDNELPHTSVPTSVADEAVNEEMDASLERAATTATSFDSEQDRANIFKTQSKATPMSLLQQRVLDLETTKTTQALEIDKLNRRIKKLERRRRIADIDANEDIYLVNVHNDKDMFGVNDLDGDEVIVENVDVVKQAKEVVDDINLAKALIEIKSSKPKANKVKDKGKGKMVKPEPVKKLLKKDQLMLDEELAFKLQSEEEKEEERLARENDQQIKEFNIAWDNVQAKINVDYELAQILQAEEQEELIDAKKAKIFMQFLDKGRKIFAAKKLKKRGTDH
nr:hypothetical protein [Tanacetum cinerariifolium]